MTFCAEKYRFNMDKGIYIAITSSDTAKFTSETSRLS